MTVQDIQSDLVAEQVLACLTVQVRSQQRSQIEVLKIRFCNC